MSSLINALSLSLFLSLLAGLILLAAGAGLERLGLRLGVAAWRSARLILLAPLLAGPVISQIPQDRLITLAEPVAFEPEAVFHGDLGDAGPVLVPVQPEMDWGTTLMLGLWLLYAAGLLTGLLQAWLRHQRRAEIVRAAGRPGLLLEQMLERLAGLVGIRRPVLRSTARVGSPALTGWNGIVLVPPALSATPQAARYALLHELVHLRRGDERDRLIGTALIIVLWFHWPLREIEKHLDAAREIACDAEVMTVLGREARKPYAATLISMMQAGAEPASAFGADNRRHCEMRIKAIMNGRGVSRHSSLLFLLVAGLAVSPVAIAQTALTDRVERFVPVYLPAVSRSGALPPEPLVEPSPPKAAAPAVTPLEEAVLRAAVSPDEPAAPQALVEPMATIVRPAAPVLETEPVEPAPVVSREAGIVSFEADEIVFAPDPAGQAVLAYGNVVVSRSVQGDRFSHRVVEGRTSSQFGNRPRRPAGSPLFHGGTDIAAPSGTPIWAAAGGVVVHAEAGFNGSERWGNTVVIDHGDGWSTHYAHMQDINVRVGQVLQAGAPIGSVGETGAATGPHLHVEVRHNGERQDPADHIPGLEHAHRN